MIDIYSKYDNMHKNEMFYVLIMINNHIITSINCMLSPYLLLCSLWPLASYMSNIFSFFLLLSEYPSRMWMLCNYLTRTLSMQLSSSRGHGCLFLAGDTNIATCRWVFTLKYNLDGTINCHKVHLVACRFSQ